MSNLINQGITYSLAEFTAVPQTLPNKVYNLRYNSNNNQYYLEETTPFQLPVKVYGDLSCIDRYIKSYENTSRNLGVLLSGLKGSGKTVLAKALCLALNQPVILINSPFDCPECAIKFLTDPALGNCTIFIDEFEKIFKHKEEELPILTLLDGPFQTHHFFLLTCNETDINTNFLNRPSRIHYHKTFSRLDINLIKEIANDLVENKEHVSSILTLASTLPKLSMDILISIIKDMNLFNEDAKTVYNHMGLTIELDRINIIQQFPNRPPIIKRHQYWSNDEEDTNNYWIYESYEDFLESPNNDIGRISITDLSEAELIDEGVFKVRPKNLFGNIKECEVFLVLPHAMHKFDSY